MLPLYFGAVVRALAAGGFETEVTATHWLGKAISGDAHIDVIIRGGNGYGEVDASWFVHAEIGAVLGLRAPICPAEETIWSKAFVMERERYDGADIAHLLRGVGPRLDWPRLVLRFGDHWRVLLAHLVLFGFVYPGERDRIPAWVTAHLTARLQAEEVDGPAPNRLCQGPLLSSKQYRIDVEAWGYEDGSLHPWGRLTARESAQR